jgi:hypothetical protein
MNTGAPCVQVTMSSLSAKAWTLPAETLLVLGVRSVVLEFQEQHSEKELKREDMVWLMALDDHRDQVGDNNFFVFSRENGLTWKQIDNVSRNLPW